ncbi:two-component sensor histidine kinase [Pseudoalteromonas sp. A25]|uniref:sensor histidine kinase n=1 Tax=Pseudoalteromonas sp. A25 TaxID=116092 RepID=UPI001260E168|nr:sensor histidine kinase [Pseudoalteromonas sp. A25]BBN83667.1 two-component sensor histidine kinase [Pseudoalteromonas sp. A25]
MFKYPLSSLVTVLLTWAAVAIPSVFDASRLDVSLIEYVLHSLVIVFTLLVINESTRYGYTFRYCLLTFLFLSIAYLMFLVPFSIILIYSVMYCSILAFYAPTRLCYAYIFVSNGLFLLAHALYWQTGWQWASVGMFMAFHFFALVMTQRMISERSAKEELALSNAKLEATQNLLRNAAAQSERLRLARDLHDEVGHALTSLIINLDIARRTCTPEQQTQLQACYKQAKQALATTRTIVSDKRNDSDFDLVQSLTQLCERTPRVAVHLEVDSEVAQVQLDTAQCLLKCVQEAITNTLKHAPTATDMNITLYRKSAHLALCIKDNGILKETVVLGNGLKGMQERVTQLKGQLDIDTSKQGLTLTIRVPYE